MAYRGFSGGGFVGNHLTTALLEQLRPAADNAGRHATVGDPTTVAAPYVSDGTAWRETARYARDANGNITSLVSGDGTPINLTPSGLWATRATLAAAGVTSAFFTDVGVGGSFWFYAGGRWRPVGGRVTLKNLTTDVSNSGAPKVVLDYAALLAGIWQDGDIIRAHVVKERTGGTADTDATDMMLGTVAATPGTTLNLSTSSLATTTLSLALGYSWRRVSSTSVRGQAVPGASGSGSSTSPNGLITGLSNLDSVDTYLQVTSDLTTAGGEVAWLRGYTVELIAGA